MHRQPGGIPGLTWGAAGRACRRNAIFDDAEPVFRTALATQRVCDAILQSAKTGTWVDTGIAGSAEGDDVASVIISELLGSGSSSRGG